MSTSCAPGVRFAARARARQSAFLRCCCAAARFAPTPVMARTHQHTPPHTARADLAAGSLLVEEAGGLVTSTRGEPYELALRDVMATNGAPALHQGALELLVKAGAASADAPEKWPPLHH